MCSVWCWRICWRFKRPRARGEKNIELYSSIDDDSGGVRWRNVNARSGFVLPSSIFIKWIFPMPSRLGAVSQRNFFDENKAIVFFVFSILFLVQNETFGFSRLHCKQYSIFLLFSFVGWFSRVNDDDQLKRQKWNCILNRPKSNELKNDIKKILDHEKATKKKARNENKYNFSIRCWCWWII